ncbi:MAG: transposase, partial [Acutalibacteraceae bacterium]|nr:transposase [Acutalibacteraceae bacterium]
MSWIAERSIIASALSAQKIIFRGCRTRRTQAVLPILLQAKAVDFCNKIYHEENLLKEMTAEERYNQRLVKVKPLLDAFFTWLETVPVKGNSKLAQAVNYALNERNYLYTFLENGNVPIDNNRAENAIRPFAVGR